VVNKAYQKQSTANLLSAGCSIRAANAANAQIIDKYFAPSHLVGDSAITVDSESIWQHEDCITKHRFAGRVRSCKITRDVVTIISAFSYTVAYWLVGWLGDL